VILVGLEVQINKSMAKKKVITEVENPWQEVVNSAESLYISIEDQYKILPKNELSSMLVSLSLIIKTAKNEYNVWKSGK
jgi:hypothetical protein